MNVREKRIYRLEVKLIQRHFKGLRPRPVQLARRLELGADGEAGEPNLIIKDRKRSAAELEALLKHELIHYELKDKGKFFHGHGRAFLRRAQALGIVNSYVLERCFSSEEFEHSPTVRKTTKVRLGKFARQVDQWFSQLIRGAVQLPEPYGSKIYPHVQNAYVGWLTYSAAVREKSHHVIQEIWKIKRGARGKDLHELQRQYVFLQAQHARLAQRLKSHTNRHQRAMLKRELGILDTKMSRIRKQVEKDYGISLG